MQKNILITGVAGFIGSNFANYMVTSCPEYEYVGLDNLSPYSNYANIARLVDEGNLRFEHADIADQKKLEAIYKKHNITHVVNFAAESHNDRAILDPLAFTRSNALGAQVILETSRKFVIDRHVHISTIEVYGEQAPDVLYFTESSRLNAKTPYSAAKAAGDLLVQAYMHTYRDMDIVITHCANNYGRYQFPEKLIPLAITNVLNDKKVPIYGDGKQKRDWLHVDDHSRGIERVLHMDKKPYNSDSAYDSSLLPIYNFSARKEVENREIIRIILDELGKDFGSWIEYVADRPNHDRRYLIDPKKAETDLGFAPQVEFDSGIRETVRWYVENKEWWQDILDRSKNLSIDWKKAKG